MRVFGVDQGLAERRPIVVDRDNLDQVMAKLGVDLRGELNAVVTGDTSRKFGNLTAGVSYALFGSE